MSPCPESRVLTGETLLAVEFCYPAETPLPEVLDLAAEGLEELDVVGGLVHAAFTNSCPGDDFMLHLTITVSL